MPSGIIGRDGWLAKIAENVPVLGYLLAFLDLLKGNMDRALRASARCTYTTIITASSAIGGILSGGPLGAALGAAAATTLAMRRRALVAERIRDPAIRREVFTAFGLKDMIEKTVSNGLFFGVGIRFIELLANLPGPLVVKLSPGQILDQFLRYHFRVLL